jgi:hypothetical protein
MTTGGGEGRGVGVGVAEGVGVAVGVGVGDPEGDGVGVGVGVGVGDDTFNVAGADSTPRAVAVICALPELKAFARPFALMLATFVFLEAQVKMTLVSN